MYRRVAASGHNAHSYISEKLDDISISPTSQIQEKDPEFGSNPVIKTFYEGKNSGHGHYDWVETPPKQLKEKTARAYDRVAIKIYKIKDTNQNTIAGRTPLKIHAIDVQSPLLVAALKPIVQGAGVFLDEHDIAKFTDPFKPLYFCYDKIIGLRDHVIKDPVFQHHLALLAELMAELFDTMRQKLCNLRQSRLINFDLAWTYFPKGTILFCGTEDCERLFRVLDTTYMCDREGKRLEISCEHIVFNGMTFEWETITVIIPAFGENVPITTLPHYPLEFHTNIASLKSRLTARGAKVLDYQGLEYREYTGTGLGEKCKKHNVSYYDYSLLATNVPSLWTFSPEWRYRVSYIRLLLFVPLYWLSCALPRCSAYIR